MTTHVIKPVSAARQLAFHQLLVAARKAWLTDALSEVLGRIDPITAKNQLGIYVPKHAQRVLAKAGIRDEHVFPIPAILQMAPTLIGYYRLLLGIPQKSFYGFGTGMSVFKSMEKRGAITARQSLALPAFCDAMSAGLTELVSEMIPTISTRDVNELPLLTIGSQFQGANNNVIGKQAIDDVFLVIHEIVKAHIEKSEARRILLKNAAGRRVIIALASDPDVSILEEFGKTVRNKVAIEIKGGRDKSNVHNRAGEAEKSHQKAKQQGFRDFWTVISKKGIDFAKLRAGSPTTTIWFDVSEMLAREGPDWEEFRSRFIGEVGIPSS